jgi:hypothetical protein
MFHMSAPHARAILMMAAFIFDLHAFKEIPEQEGDREKTRFPERPVILFSESFPKIQPGSDPSKHKLIAPVAQQLIDHSIR